MAMVLVPETATRLAQHLEAAHRIDPAILSTRARIALQNDIWGLVQRIEAVSASSEARDRLARAAIDLVQKLALPSRILEAQNPFDRPPAMARALGEGFEEVGTELVILNHEHLFGLRRVFRLFVDDDRRALASQLVALDTKGQPHLTDVPGDVEILEFDGPRVNKAHAYALDHARLQTPDTKALLTKKDPIAHLPATGANGFLARFDPPKPLAELPCQQCHQSRQAMSLFSKAILPYARQAALLDQIQAPFGKTAPESSAAP